MKIRGATFAVVLLLIAPLVVGCGSPSPSSSPTASAVESSATVEQAGELSFAVEADPHMDERSDASVFTSTLSQINAVQPAFLIDLGDIFMVDKLPDKSDVAIRGRFELMKSFYDQLDPSIELHFAMGNHDAEAGWDSVNTHSYRMEYFPAETRELNYYSIEHDDALMIVLDPFSYTERKPKEDGWGWTLGKQQYDWLVTTLRESKQAHKFVFIHHLVGGESEGRGGVEWAPYFEWGGANLDGTSGFAAQRPGWEMPIKDVLEKYGVQIVFKGHDHFYAHQEYRGITYQTLPQPSHPGNKLNDDPEKWGYASGTILGGSGFLHVTTREGLVTVEFIDYSGQVVDSYDITN